MTRYIDADEYYDELLKMESDISFSKQEINGIRNAIASLQAQPTADVQPVVHCKDCKWFGKGRTGSYCYNDFWNYEGTPIVFPEDYCSHGEKIGSDGNA